MFKLVGDASQWVRQEVIRLLHQSTIMAKVIIQNQQFRRKRTEYETATF